MVLWNFDLLWRTMPGAMVKNYGTVDKTMVLYRPRTVELRFTKEKNVVDYQKLRNFEL